METYLPRRAGCRAASVRHRDGVDTSNAVPRLAREQWALHPNYPAQVLLLGSHQNFRRINRYLIEEAGKAGSLKGLHRTYTSWISAMRSHERYEERKLYPYLARRWGVSFETAIAGHHALHDADLAVHDAFAAAGRNAAAEAHADVVAALTRHEAVLLDHLDHEEDAVIPLLLALEPAEFDAYADGR
jgi:hypothetical protein